MRVWYGLPVPLPGETKRYRSSTLNKIGGIYTHPSWLVLLMHARIVYI
jgi:hypothetical protein